MSCLFLNAMAFLRFRCLFLKLFRMMKLTLGFLGFALTAFCSVFLAVDEAGRDESFISCSFFVFCTQNYSILLE